MKRYEAMFLFDNAAVQEWSAMEAEVDRLFGRIGAEKLVCVKYDERKLAYEINGRKRGTYVLTYFDADPNRITDLERDARLSEQLLRIMVLRAEKLNEKKLEELKAHTPDQSLQPISSEGRRGEGGPSRDYRGSGGRTEAPKEPAKAATATATAVADKPVADKTPKSVADKPVADKTPEPVVEPADKPTPEPTPEVAPEPPPAAEAPENKPADE